MVYNDRQKKMLVQSFSTFLIPETSLLSVPGRSQGLAPACGPVAENQCVRGIKDPGFKLESHSTPKAPRDCKVN